MNRYLIGYGVSSVLGGPIAWGCWALLDSLVKAWHLPKGQPPAERTPWLSMTMGVVERAIYTTLVAFNVPGAGAFIGAWVTIKALGGWSPLTTDRTPYMQRLFMTGLLSSGVSALMGVLGGILIRSFGP